MCQNNHDKVDVILEVFGAITGYPEDREKDK